jgi:hypothetical protein
MTGGSNGYSTSGLRDDPRQWLIYGEAQRGAFVRGVTAMALVMTGRHLKTSKMIQVRAVGDVMESIGNSQIRVGVEAGGYRKIVLGYLVRLMTFAAGQGPPPPPNELDELHAVAFETDHVARRQGLNGSGLQRELIRGDR